MSTKILQAAPDPELERLLKVERLAFERYDRLRGYSVWRKEAAEQDRPHARAPAAAAHGILRLTAGQPQKTS